VEEKEQSLIVSQDLLELAIVTRILTVIERSGRDRIRGWSWTELSLIHTDIETLLLRHHRLSRLIQTGTSSWHVKTLYSFPTDDNVKIDSLSTA
jgi:hypothetical protein